MKLQAGTIAYYITPHGFGHAVRSLEVIRRLLEMSPSTRILIVSDIPDFLVIENTGVALPLRRKRLDVGLVQLDSLKFDLEATREALEGLSRDRERLISEESAFLEREQVDVVVSDVAFLPFWPASQCGVPSIGIGNFTWDWIYQSYGKSDSRWSPLIAWIREGYGACDRFLQLPMHGDCSACPRVEDVPLIARKARRAREESRRVLGMSPEEKAYLISFAHLDLDEAALRQLERIHGAVFFFKRPLRFHFKNGRSLDERALPYADVVAVMDAVITKPGYGIVSDCLAHGTPIIYTDRGEFPEYGVLVREMSRHLPTIHMPSRDLYAGNWASAINRLHRFPRRTPAVGTDGASVCAQIILETCSASYTR